MDDPGYVCPAPGTVKLGPVCGLQGLLTVGRWKLVKRARAPALCEEPCPRSQGLCVCGTLPTLDYDGLSVWWGSPCLC